MTTIKADYQHHDEINHICTDISQNLENILGQKLLGVYLTGSLTYGDFNKDSSDIDLLIILRDGLSDEERELVKNMHHIIAQMHPHWENRIEASYITRDMLNSESPPTIPRPYINNGQMYDAPYGYEWLLNIHAWYECGIALVGAAPNVLMSQPVSIESVKIASKHDFYQEWEPLLIESSALNDSHFQAYATLTLCRILHREKNNNVASKKVAAAWVNKTYGNRWKPLIEKAQN